MALSADTRLRMERVVAAFRQKLASAHGTDVEWTRRYRSGDEGAMDELVQQACAEAEIPVAEYREAVDTDAQLGELHQRCVREVLLGAVRNSRFE
jgi:deoxyribodipyrimidine photolyase